MPDSEHPTRGIMVEIDCPGLDVAIEKANRLVELLREASDLIDSLSGGLSLEA